MPRIVHAVLALLLVGSLVLSHGARARAAYDLETAPSRWSGLELVVVEAEGCIYCRIFRRDVLPAYAASPRAQSVPMRFADLNALEAGTLTLAGPIDSVPTVLVLSGNRELGRVSGYVGPESFFHAINGLLAGVE